jgi:hypothetical protein
MEARRSAGLFIARETKHAHMVRTAGRRPGDGCHRRNNRSLAVLTAIGNNLTLPRSGRSPQKGTYAHLHFQIGRKPELACVFG